MRILVVDDDETDRGVLTQRLREAGYEDVVDAASAAETFAVLGVDGGSRARAQVDLILLDIELPLTNGLAILTRIKEAPRLGRVPVIVVTGHTEDEFLESAFAAGAVDYLVKPVRQRELLARVRNAVRLKEERDKRTTREHVLRQTNRSLELLSGQDTLTRLANRRQFQHVFRVEWRRAARERERLSLLMIDVDHFHEYNERWGHLAGDACLRRLAGALTEPLRRAGDLVARYGGEEFVVVLPRTDEDGARRVGEQLRAAVAALAMPHERSSAAPHVTISVGAATEMPSVDKAPESIIASADEALFLAKRAGRDRVRSAQTPTVQLPAIKI